MFRLLLCLAMMFGAGVATGHPPDAVPHSPVPPLKEPARRVPQRLERRAARAKPRRDQTQNLLPLPLDRKRTPSARQGKTSQPQKSAPSSPPAQPQAPPAEGSEANAPEEYATDPNVIWNSEAMREARAFVREFSRRAKGTTPAEGEQFLEELAKLPAAEMRGWLHRYQERRMSISFQREVEQMARQLMLEHAFSRQEAVRRAYANVSQQKAEAAAARQAQLEAAARARGMAAGDSWILGLQPTYDPMYPSFDPARRLAEDLLLGVPVERAAAAASLPGDLPREDPRNYERGEPGDDFVEVEE